MLPSNPKIVVVGWVFGAILGATSCGSPRVPPPSVSELVEDRVMLDGLLLKCNSNAEFAKSGPDCANARVAVDRLAAQAEVADSAKREAEFERRRDRLRQLQDQQRAQKELESQIDAYHLPVVPVDPPTPTPTPPAKAPDPLAPVLGQTNH
jgi:hypothetical protein